VCCLQSDALYFVIFFASEVVILCSLGPLYHFKIDIGAGINRNNFYQFRQYMLQVSAELIILRHLNTRLRTRNEMHIYIYIYILNL
jgi:hypothetical protein